MGRYGKGGRLRLSAKRCKRGQYLPNRKNRKKEVKSFQVEKIETKQKEIKPEGRRIIDLYSFITSLQDLDKHSAFGCSFKDMEIIKEKRYGLNCSLTFKCKMCNIERSVWTCGSPSSEKTGEEPMHQKVNTDAVNGIVNIGCGYSNLNSFLAILDIPPISQSVYAKEHKVISEAWEKLAYTDMENAAMLEKELAIKCGDVDKSGTPLISVIVDGSWGKRSYRTNYSSLSGTAAIIGAQTGKLIYMGMRNKYCAACTRADNLEVETKTHKCFKNWNWNSTAMESDIIVEGFCESMKMYGIKYHRIIGDGDSNVYKMILDARPYDNLMVEKIECKNHLLRNFCNKLRDLARNSKLGHIDLRRKIGHKVKSMREGITKAIFYRKSSTDELPQKISKLRGDILNCPSHYFGDHTRCDLYYCKYKQGIKQGNSNNEVPALKHSGLFYKLLEIFQILSDNAKSLLYNVSTNKAENFNSLIAKFLGGKIINYSLKDSYNTRCTISAAHFNRSRPLYAFHKALYKFSPSSHTKKLEDRRLKARIDAQNRRTESKAKKRLFLKKTNSSTQDKNYGSNAEKPDLDLELYTSKCKEFLENLAINDEEIKHLEEETRSQRDSAVWHFERRKRLTASFFGQVCHKLSYTSCKNIVKSILYSNVDTIHMKYGRIHESDAVKYIANHLNIEVKSCGFFVKKEEPYLGATPDGLIGDDGIIEIKCPSSCSKFTPEEAIKNRKFPFLKFNSITNEITVNKNNNYFFQIQGQLHITNRNYCLFVMWTPLGVYNKKIERDVDFWNTKMSQKLKDFFYDCMMPELVDPRHTRSMEIRDPLSILNAQEKRKTETLNKK